IMVDRPLVDQARVPAKVAIRIAGPIGFIGHEVRDAVFRVNAGEPHRAVEVVRLGVPYADVEIEPAGSEVASPRPASRNIENGPKLAEAKFVNTVLAVGTEIARFVEVIGI